MDLNLNDQEQLIRRAALDFCRREVPASLVREMEHDPRGFPADLWTSLSALGWPGMLIPEAHGGVGRTLLDLAVLLEATGEYLLPAPLMASAAGGAGALLLAGSEPQQRRWLPGIAGGQVVATVADAERNRDSGPASVQCRARRDGDGWRLTGEKLFVPWGQVANLLIVSARTGDAPDDVALFAVDGAAAALERQRHVDLSETNSLAWIRLNGVRVDADRALGDARSGWSALQRLRQWITVGLCAELVGMGQRVLDMTVAYAKDRIQFGRPIGSFQAVQYRCVEVLGDVEGARQAMHQAAYMVAEGSAAATYASEVAAAWAAEVMPRVAQNGHQVHGAIGFSDEHPMQLYSRRIMTQVGLLGPAGDRQAAVAVSAPRA